MNDWLSNRGSHRGCSVAKGVLRNFAKFTGKLLCQSLLDNNCFEYSNFGKFTRKDLCQSLFKVELLDNFIKKGVSNNQHYFNKGFWHDFFYESCQIFQSSCLIGTSGRLHCQQFSPYQILYSVNGNWIGATMRSQMSMRENRKLEVSLKCLTFPCLTITSDFLIKPP